MTDDETVDAITHLARTVPVPVRGALPIDDRHALYIGAVLGIAMRHGLDVRLIVDDAGNYTDQLMIVLSDAVLTVIVPPPPEDWTIHTWWPDA